MGSFIAARGFWKPGNELFLPVLVIASVRQRLSKQTLQILSSTDR